MMALTIPTLTQTGATVFVRYLNIYISIRRTREGKEGKRYLRVYIQIRFRHACHETRDRQSRSLVSGQEEGWGEVKVLLKF